MQDVQIALPKVHDPLPVRTLDIGIANIPLLRDRPVEDCGPSWDLNDLQRNAVLDQGQGLSDAVTRDAPADRVQFCREAVQCPDRFPSGPSARVPSAGAWHVLPVRVCSVPFGNHFHYARPNNLEGRIIPPHAPRRFRMVEF